MERGSWQGGQVVRGQVVRGQRPSAERISPQVSFAAKHNWTSYCLIYVPGNELITGAPAVSRGREIVETKAFSAQRLISIARKYVGQAS